jgi:hypothetical protein
MKPTIRLSRPLQVGFGHLTRLIAGKGRSRTRRSLSPWRKALKRKQQNMAQAFHVIKGNEQMIGNRNVVAWLLLVSAVGLHVLDETMTGFLPFYNQSVINLRERLGFFPLPIFSFNVWLGGLIGAIIFCYCITPLVARGGKVIRVVTVVLGVLMIMNALGHLLGSVYFGKVIPGMWSAPFLLVAALLVVIRGLRGDYPIKNKSMGVGA